MTWASLDPQLRNVAEQVCTSKELDALKLWNQNWGYQRIGLHLGIARETARARVQRSLQKIAIRKQAIDQEKEANAA